MVTAPTHKALTIYGTGSLPAWLREFAAFLAVMGISLFISVATVSVAYRAAVSGGASAQAWVEPRVAAVTTASYQQDTEAQLGSFMPLRQAVIKEAAKDRH